MSFDLFHKAIANLVQVQCRGSALEPGKPVAFSSPPWMQSWLGSYFLSLSPISPNMHRQTYWNTNERSWVLHVFHEGQPIDYRYSGSSWPAANQQKNRWSRKMSPKNPWIQPIWAVFGGKFESSHIWAVLALFNEHLVLKPLKLAGFTGFLVKFFGFTYFSVC